MLARPSIVALASATSANTVDREGAAFNTEQASVGTISVLFTSGITTSTVQATFRLQASQDGTTFYDVETPTSTIPAGTGSLVTTNRVMSFPASVINAVSVRVVAKLSVTTTGVGDTTSATYYYVPRGKLIN